MVEICGKAKDRSKNLPRTFKGYEFAGKNGSDRYMIGFGSA